MIADLVATWRAEARESAQYYAMPEAETLAACANDLEAALAREASALDAIQRFVDLIDRAHAASPQTWVRSLKAQTDEQNRLYSQAFALLTPFARSPR